MSPATPGLVLIAGPDQAARAAQIAALAPGLGRPFDLLWVAAPGAPPPPDLAARARRRGGLRSGAALAEALAPPLAEWGGDIVVALGAALAPALGAVPEGALRVLDQGLGPSVEPDATARPDLGLAADETARGRLAQSLARPALRLPLPLPPAPPGPSVPRPYLGWVGVWDAALTGAWADLVAALGPRGGHLPGGILIAGPGAATARVPAGLGPVLRVGDPARWAAARRALGAAVLPLETLEGRGDEIAALVAAGAPVLLPAALARAFEHRWHGPRVADLDDLAGQLAAAGPGLARHGPPAPWAEAAARSAAAWAYDHAAMTAHVTAELARAAAAL